MGLCGLNVTRSRVLSHSPPGWRGACQLSLSAEAVTGVGSGVRWKIGSEEVTEIAICHNEVLQLLCAYFLLLINISFYRIHE